MSPKQGTKSAFIIHLQDKYPPFSPFFKVMILDFCGFIE